MNWIEYSVVVPFGNDNYDTQYYASHDMTLGTPPNTEITAILPGVISDISSPIWGKQVCIKLTTPYHGVEYMAYLHLSAVEAGLRVGSHIFTGSILGWSGGCTSQSQYAGTGNPTGQNFLNDPSQSSQPQVGIALMHGPVYGSGKGWETFPPIDQQLDPTQLVVEYSMQFKEKVTEMVPQGWSDDGTSLHNPENQYIVTGPFRVHILSQSQWYPGNIPEQNQETMAQLELSNPAIGSGISQIFSITRLESSPTFQGGVVFEGWVGQELLKVYELLKQAQSGGGITPAAPMAALMQLVADFSAAMQKFQSAIS